MNYNNVIGNGPMFPIQLSQLEDGTTTWGIEEGTEDLLLTDLYSLLSHNLGQMFRQENVGHRLTELLEEPSTEVVFQLAKKFCMDFLNSHEVRIKPISIDDIEVVKVGEGVISIEINSVLNNNEKLNPITVYLN